MSDISDIEIKVRQLVDDNIRTQSPGDVFTYGSSTTWTLTEENVIAITDVYRNGVALTGGDYTFDSSTNKITIITSLTTGDSIEVQYTFYCNFSATEIENYIRGAVTHIALNNYQCWEVDTDDNFFPDISNSEKNLIAIVTSILMKPDNISYRLPDIGINVPNSMPTRDLVSKAIRIFKTNTSGVFDIIGTS